MHRAVELQIPPKRRQHGTLQLLAAQIAGAGKVLGKALFPRCKDRRLLSQHGFPPLGLERVDQLIFLHPLLPREQIFRRKKFRRVCAPQLREHRTHGKLLFIHRVFERQPRKVVKGALPHIARPVGEETLLRPVAKPLVHKADDAVHVKVRLAVRLKRQKLRLERIIPARGPDEVDRPALPGRVACRLHLSR